MRKHPPAGIGDGTDEVRVVHPGEKTENAIEHARRSLPKLEAKRAREGKTAPEAESETRAPTRAQRSR